MPSNHKVGWLFAALFAAGFGYFQWKHFLGWAIISAFLAVLFTLATIFAPTILTPLNRAWFALSLFLGKVVSPIVLSAIFFILITPVALITRLFGRDVLLLKKRQVSSYWVDKEPIEPDSFKNQF
jgi:hypothetical protein